MNVIREALGVATIARIKDQVADLNKRTKRLGLDPVTFERGPWYGVETVDSYGRKRSRTVADIIVTAPDVPLKRPGWSLAGVVTGALKRDLNADERIVMRFDDSADLARYRAGPVTCDECRKARLRKTMLVVRNEEGEQRIVGGSCAKLYVPRNATISYLEALADFDPDPDDDERSFNAPRFSLLFPIRETVETALMWIMDGGYRKRSEHGSTADIVWSTLCGGLSKAGAERFAELVERHGDKLLTRADDIIAFVESMSESSDYLANLRAAFRAGAVSSRTIGIVVSAVPTWERATRRAEERKAQKPAKHADAPEGSTADLGEGIVTGIRSCQSFYGESWIVNIRLDDGANLVWFASSYPTADGRDVEKGDRYHVRAHIKAHGDYRGTPQTKVNRVKFRAPVGA